MTEEQQIVKDALEYVMASAATGVDKTKLLGALRNLDGTPLSPEQREHVPPRPALAREALDAHRQGHARPGGHVTAWT